MFGHGVEDASEWVRAWTDEAAHRATSAQRMAEEVAAVSATVTDRSGIITVTVDSAGVLTRLDLTDDIRRMDGAALAADILATVRRAQADLAARVGSVVAGTVGVDSPTGATVVERFQRRFPDPVVRDDTARADRRD